MFTAWTEQYERFLRRTSSRFPKILSTLFFFAFFSAGFCITKKPVFVFLHLFALRNPGCGDERCQRGQTCSGSGYECISYIQLNQGSPSTHFSGSVGGLFFSCETDFAATAANSIFLRQGTFRAQGTGMKSSARRRCACPHTRFNQG